MDLAFTDEQDMLRKAVRSLCADAADSVRAMENDPKGFDDDFWQGLAAMGLTGLMTSEALGGSDMGLLDAVVVYEELGRSLVPSPHLASAVVAAGVLATAGSDAQQAEWLPAMATAANKSCIKLLAKQLGIALSQITIVGGQKGRNKIIRIEEIEESEFITKILKSNKASS